MQQGNMTWELTRCKYLYMVYSRLVQPCQHEVNLSKTVRIKVIYQDQQSPSALLFRPSSYCIITKNIVLKDQYGPKKVFHFLLKI